MPVTLGSVEVSALLFRHKHFRATYIVGRDDMDSLEFMKRYPDSGRVKSHGLEDDGKFYLVFVADCFDPPKAIIRASNESDALEIFGEEFTWAQISQEDANEMFEEQGDDCNLVYVRGAGNDTIWFDPSNVEVHEVSLFGLENDK